MTDTITTAQLKERLQVGNSAATRIMSEILSLSNTLRIKGVCHQQDYEFWLAIKKGKGEKK